MGNRIHPTAIVDPAARLGDDVEVGPYSIIEADVHIGDRCRIASQVLIAGGARLGSECQVFKGAVVGNLPQDLKYEGEDSEVVVGDRTVLREYCTISRGTGHGGLKTRVGSDCMLMAYAHVAHDCILGDHVILANGVQMAGHVEIEDYVSVSGLTVIHQFVRIGRYAYIGGLSRISHDVPPYILTLGESAAYRGPNAVGLRRWGFTSKQVSTIKRVYRYIYRSNLNLTQALEAINSEIEPTEEMRIILEFIERSKRGLGRG